MLSLQPMQILYSNQVSIEQRNASYATLAIIFIYIRPIFVPHISFPYPSTICHLSRRTELPGVGIVTQSNRLS
jgi:hypothetical protein